MKRSVIFFITALFCFSAFAQINELERVTPESVGVNSDDVVSMMNALMAYDQTSVHSVVVLRHGKVIAETYPAPFKPEYKHTLYSTSKTFTSAAVGIAIAENRLRLTDRVISFFPEVPIIRTSKTSPGCCKVFIAFSTSARSMCDPSHLMQPP